MQVIKPDSWSLFFTLGFHFFLTSHWYWIPAVFFWSYLKSWPQLCELWLHCLLYQDKDGWQLSSGRLEFGYIFNFSSWQTHKPVRRRGTLLGKASFHLDWFFLLLTESKRSNPFWQDMGSGQGWKTGACWDLLLSIVSLSVWELQWSVTNLERGMAETLVFEGTCCEEPNFTWSFWVSRTWCTIKKTYWKFQKFWMFLQNIYEKISCKIAS